VAAERRHGEHGIASRGARRHRLLRHCSEHVYLLGRERLRRGRICFATGEVPQEK
jgi:hypothetical protein